MIIEFIKCITDAMNRVILASGFALTTVKQYDDAKKKQAFLKT